MTRDTINDLVMDYLTDPHAANVVTICPPQRYRKRVWRAAPRSRMTRAMYGYQGS